MNADIRVLLILIFGAENVIFKIYSSVYFLICFRLVLRFALWLILDFRACSRF